jgi:hypothetical protein
MSLEQAVPRLLLAAQGVSGFPAGLRVESAGALLDFHRSARGASRRTLVVLAQRLRGLKLLAAVVADKIVNWHAHLQNKCVYAVAANNLVGGLAARAGMTID